MSDLGRIKGAVFGEFLTWYAQTHGVTEVRRAAQALLGRFPDAFELDRPHFGVLASRWYRAEIVHALLDALVLGKSEPELQKMAADAAAHIMRKTISGIYKSLFSLVVTPERYVKHIDKIWQLHYDSGRPIVENDGPTIHHIRYEGWRSHHPMICRLNMSAGKPIYESMGCKDVVSRSAGCISKGAAACETIVSWR